MLLREDYSTETDDIIQDLYAPCLRASTRYDRAVGYFRANIYRELGEPLLDFVLAGGRVKIVCSPDLPLPDENAARGGYGDRGTRAGPAVEADLLQVLDVMRQDPQEADCLSMLRLLIEAGALELLIATRPGGIYHRKLGLFRDSTDDFVIFSGSGNETEPALACIENWSNDEEFDVFRSWGEPYEARKAEKKAEYLARLIAGGTEHTVVRPLSQVEREVIDGFRTASRLDECRPGAHRRTARQRPVAALKPYYYQTEAASAWHAANDVGILSMATGTGKTIAALLCTERFIREGNPVLIVVPSKLLVEQWRTEFRRAYPDVPLLIAGGGHDWRGDPGKRMFISDLRRPRAILATMQTASRPEFLEFLSQSEGTVLVADEVHRLGSVQNRRLLELPFIARLGLSATPERLFDPDGAKAILDSFGSRPAYTLGIGDRVKLRATDATTVPILGRFLSPYTYAFEPVRLTPPEEADWRKLTKEITLLVARLGRQAQDSLMSDSRLQMLLIRRARIVKKAHQKIALAGRLIAERFPSGGRWIVYCEDESQLDAVTESIRRTCPRVAVLKYHSGLSGDARVSALEYFEENPSVLVSIRCLDEGVDLPAADGGLILASSSNPREYVQRRGRLLRKALGKVRSEITDAIVLPALDADEGNVPVSIVRGELARAYNFAQFAENSEVTHRLWRVCQEYGVNLDRDAESAASPDGNAEET